VSTKLISKTKVILKIDYVEVNGHKFYVDNKKVVIDPSKKELNMASWLSKIFNKNVYILPKVHLPEGIKTADYLINNEKWDLKNIVSNRNNAIYNRIRKNENQSSNFIIDISRTKLTIKSATKQIEELFISKNFKWFKRALIKKNKEYIIIVRQK